MAKTYGKFPGVKVKTSSGKEKPDAPNIITLSDKEIQLCIIIALWTSAIRYEDGHLVFDLEEAKTALQSLGYKHYATGPMLNESIQQLGERIEDGSIDLEYIPEPKDL